MNSLWRFKQCGHSQASSGDQRSMISGRSEYRLRPEMRHCVSRQGRIYGNIHVRWPEVKKKKALRLM